MSSRELVLQRVRSALEGVPAPEEWPGQHRPTSPQDRAPQLLSLLEERLADYRAVVRRSSGTCVPPLLAELIGGSRVAVPPGLDPSWIRDLHVVPDDGSLTPAALAELDGVITGCAVAIAETGTIILDASPDQGRRVLTLVPDLHICVVRFDQIVATVQEAVARIRPERALTWISGPSATSDIELSRVEGVHGPRDLIVVLVEDGHQHDAADIELPAGTHQVTAR
jgi:L-lactate dehydrogenase complex protein LldG